MGGARGGVHPVGGGGCRQRNVLRETTGPRLLWVIDGPGKRSLWGQAVDTLAVWGVRAKDAKGLNEESVHGAREEGLGSSETQLQLWLTPPERPASPMQQGPPEEVVLEVLYPVFTIRAASTRPSSFSLLFPLSASPPSLPPQSPCVLRCILNPPFHLLEAQLSSCVGKVHLCPVL